jgi:pimeloyl-ACP methyl ester carboxylesterase
MGSGPPLVYLPGLDGTAEMLFPHERELAERYTLLRVRSRDARPFDYDVLIEDVVEALDAQGVRGALVLGESFGSTLALRLALERPDRVERLVLVSGFAYFPDRTLLRVAHAVECVVPHAVLQGIRRSVVVPLLAVDGVASELRRRFVDIALARPFDGYFGRVSLVSRFDARDRLAEIRVPTLVVAGDRDKLVPVGCSIELARRIPTATLRVLCGAGHACLLAPGVSVARLVEEWVGSDEAAEAGAPGPRLSAPCPALSRSTPARGA